MEIKTGYKHIGIGVIPEDWELYPLPELTIKKDNSIKIGPFGSQLKKNLLTKSGYKVYGQENVYENDMSIGERYISKEHYLKLKSCCVNVDDFLISMMGTVGKCLIIPSKFEDGIIDSHLIRLRLNHKKIDSRFLLYLFASEIVLNQISKLSVGAIMEGLSSSIIRKLVIPLPPTKTEQYAIAEALSDIDTLIENLEKLIAKNKNIKQGAMQLLLNGKKRLPGFSGEWKEKSIGDVCKIFGRIGFRGYTVNDIVANGEGAISISPSNILEDKTDFSNCTYISLFKYEESPEIKIYNGDILLVKTGSTFGKTAIVKNLNDKATLNPQLVVLKNILINNLLLSYLMNSNTIQNQIRKTIVGGAIPTLSQQEIASFTIKIPIDTTEQMSIAQVLSDMDAEIEELELKLAKYKLIKQGMMQELLTGKKRLI
jgi:type I restriction enzyme S subunit